MDGARWNRIEDLLQAALDLEPSRRAAFLSASCGSDHDVRRDVESLLARESDAAVLSGGVAPGAIMPDAAPAVFEVGRKIGRYRIERRIGSGGMAEVYEARDESLQRSVALKVLPAEFTDDPERVRRFEQEAFAASRLNHPNIITIFEILHADGLHLIVNERVEGKTLRELLTDPATDGPQRLPVAQALQIGIQIAAALKAAHTAWIIHRDVKPENVMVRSDGLVKVLDFGIAKLSEEALRAPDGAVFDGSPESTLTLPGAVMGTARYMSPEQARGEPLDGRTDLFSIGVVMYEMVTGQRFAAGRTRATLQRGDVGHALAAGARPVPRELQRIIARMLQPDRAERYSSAAELLDDLQALQRRIENRPARRMIGLGALAVMLALLVTAAGAWLSVSESWDERILRDGHTAAVRQVLFSPDGRWLVSCGEDARLIVWDFARRERVRTISGMIEKIAFSPDGRLLAAGYHDGSVVVRETSGWQTTRVLRENRTEIGALAFSPDGSLLVAGSYEPIDGRTVVWRTAGWTKLRDWNTGGFGTYVFSADGRQMLSARAQVLFDLASGWRSPDSGDLGGNWAALAPGGRELAVIDPQGRLSFYRLPVRGDLRRREPILRRPAHQDHGRSIVYSPDGLLVASAAEDILLWDARTRRKLARFEHSAITWSIAFSPDGKWLVSSHADGAVLVWDVAERERRANLNEHSGAVRAVAFSPDGRVVASGGEDRTVTIWDPRNGRRKAILLAHTTRVTALAFLGGGGRIATADQDGRVIAWDFAAREPRVVVATAKLPAFSMAASPDGRFIATPAGIYGIDGRLINDFSVLRYANAPYGVAFSRDGRRLAGATEGGYVFVWNTERPDRPRLLDVQRVPGTSQISVSISPDGTSLVTGEDEGAIRLWSVAPLRQLAILGRHGARVKSVAFSPDGATVASAGDDKVIALWDVKRRALRGHAGTHASPIYSVAFSPDGRQLLSGEHDHSVRVYTRHRTLWGFELE